ncbi:MAG: hypothetical protein U0414_20070 [Polyangiaceae bacterium]
MAIPAALVLLEIDQVDFRSTSLQGDLATASQPYLLVRIGPRRIGRTRVIPAGAASLDLAAERGEFSHRLRVAAGEDIPVVVEVWSADEGTYPLATLETSVSDPWTFGPRVVSDVNLAVHFRVFTRPVPAPIPTGVAPRSTASTTTQATLRIPDTAVVELTDIVGAYEPDPDPTPGAPLARRRAGYLALDDKGRVYRNRRLDGSFKADVQLIEVHATVNVVRGFLPADAKLRWTVVDVDDPTNDDPDVHPEAGVYIDAKDYDPNTGEHLGSMGFDNEGRFDRDPRWEAVAPYALSVDSESQAKTSIVANRSVVRIHCPNVGGDSFIVRAELVSDAELESFADETGILSMWDRIDVEYVKMKTADPLPVDEVAVKFEPAFVQLDFTAPRVIPDKPFIARTEKDLDTKLRPFVDAHFQHLHQPGWFILISALQAVPTGPPVPVLYDGEITLTVDPNPPFKTTFVLPGLHPDAYAAALFWWDAEDDPSPHRAEFLANDVSVVDDPYEPVTVFEVDFHDYFPLVHVGTEKFLFGPRHQFRRGAWETGGYGIGEARAVVNSLVTREIDGISSGTAGRTVIFTASKKDADTGQVPPHVVAHRPSVIAHELTHALGFEHKCGNWDLRLPRVKPCIMDYRGQWLLRWKTLADVRLDPDTGDEEIPTAVELCATHAREIRRVHLEDNTDLGWK